MSIDGLNGYVFGTFSIQSVEGEQILGSSRLLVNVLMQPASHQQARDALHGATLVALAGELRIRDQTGRLQPIALLQPVSPVCIEVNRQHPPMPLQIQLRAELGSHRTEAIEKLRSGGNLHIDVHLSGQVYQAGKFTVGAEYLQVFKVDQSRWLEILSSMGAKKVLLIEIPVPEDAGSDFQRAAKNFESAQHALLHGDYRATVGDCRHVLEALGSALNDENQLPPEWKDFFKGTRAWSKDTRMSAIRRAVHVYTHQAMHSDDASVTSFDRAEALAILSITAVLLRRFNQ